MVIYFGRLKIFSHFFPKIKINNLSYPKTVVNCILATKDVPLLTDLRSSIDGDTEGRKTYATAWKEYINGNVVTEMQKRYIQNLLLATTTKVQAELDETSSEESEFEYNPQERSIGNLTIAEKTIAGLAANDEDMGSLNTSSWKIQ